MRIRRPSHSTVVAYLALFAALGGSAYAVSKVGTSDLKRSAVTSAKIENRAIKGSDVKNGALGGRQIREGALKPGFGYTAGASGECDVTAVPTLCADLRINLKRSSSPLLISTAGATSGTPGTASGHCQLAVGGVQGQDPIRVKGTDTAIGSAAQIVQLGLDDPVPKGHYEGGLTCTEESGDLRLTDVRIAVVDANPPG